VHQERTSDGRRRITSVVEMSGEAQGDYALHELAA
jgi:hypothetical protein